MELPICEALFARIADDLATQGWCVIADALSPHRLAQEAERQPYHPAKIAAGTRAQRRALVRSDHTAWIDCRSDAQAEWLHWCENLRASLNRSLFMGVQGVESHFARYLPGDRYRRHFDATARSNARVVSVVTYLNRYWQDGDGGELQLYSRQGELIRCVTPEFGTLVLFLSDQFPHEVLPVASTRYSITTWLRRRESVFPELTPASETNRA